VLDFLSARSCRFVFRRLKDASTVTWQEREKLRNSGSMLYLVNYHEDRPEPEWIQIPDVKAFAPLFHPDGKRVVFNSTFAPSEIFILSLDTLQPKQVGFGAHPHWWVDPASGESWIVYRTHNQLFTGFPLGKTMRQHIDASNSPLGEPEMICPYGFGGGITPDGRFLATGYAHLIVADRQTGEYYQGLGDRQLPDGENQVCDVSVSPDGSKRVMHLRLTERGEGRHDFFGVCNFDGSNYISFTKPEGTQEWQTPEWSSHPDFATAVATRYDNTYDIYVIRISDQQYLRLTWDGGYGHVHLWLPRQTPTALAGQLGFTDDPDFLRRLP
jgi:Tol biopolymer transport system component